MRMKSHATTWEKNSQITYPAKDLDDRKKQSKFKSFKIWSDVLNRPLFQAEYTIANKNI